MDYRTHDVVDEVRRIAGEREPLDLVLDAIGGRSFKQSFSLLRPGGRLVCFGASEIQAGERRSRARALRVLAQMPRFNPVKLMSESKSVIGLNMLDALGREAARSTSTSRRCPSGSRAAPSARWSPRRFPLEQGAEAHRYLHARENIGKVVLEP